MTRASQTAIARKLNISQMTVSRVLRGENNISPITRDRVIKAAQESGYRYNRLATSLLNGRTQIIGVLMPLFSAPYFANILEGIQIAARENDYSLLPLVWNKSSDVDDQEINLMMQYQVDAFITVPKSAVSWEESIYSSMVNSREKIIFVNQQVPIKGSHSIISDDFNGAKQAVRYLVENGHRHIGLISQGSQRGAALKPRTEGYLVGLRDAGIKPEEHLIISEDEQTSSFKDVLSKLISKHPKITAFFCHTDGQAMETIRILEQLGVKIPDDISIVGFGNNIEYPDLMRTPLTTVSQHPIQIGSQAVELLFKLIKGENASDCMEIGTELIIRQSVREIKEGTQ